MVACLHPLGVVPHRMMAWYTEGLASYAFALSLFLYLTIIRDAAGIRQHLGRHGQMLKRFAARAPKDHQHNIAHDKIVPVRTYPWQIVVGSICGVASQVYNIGSALIPFVVRFRQHSANGYYPTLTFNYHKLRGRGMTHPHLALRLCHHKRVNTAIVPD